MFTCLVRPGLRIEELRVSLRLTGPFGFAQGRLPKAAVPTGTFSLLLSMSSYGNSRVTNLAGFVPVLVMVWE
jgi:hypothetical protein